MVYAIDDVCSHKGASLSLGSINNNCITCPYHGYEFDGYGSLCYVPGINFTKSNKYNIPAYMTSILGNDFVLLNTNSSNMIPPILPFIKEFNEPDLLVIDNSIIYDANYKHIVKNSLDIMHIAYVHTFGNKKRPNPISYNKPRRINHNHWGIKYVYETGENSMAKSLFGIDELIVENEFIYPYITIARVKFGEYLNTVITSTLPISKNKTQLIVKTFRNYWHNPVGDWIQYQMMKKTMLEDKKIVESINKDFKDNGYYMKYDTLEYIYDTFCD
jgi:phenylpropionate dioxygenase-like ring-hydroxylating dioxygenase large terminal subunit